MTHDGVGAREYHERTKHSPESVRQGGHRLDFDNKPRPYKVYENRPALSLARSIRPPQQPALAAVAESTADGRPDRRPDRDALAALCYYAAGITKVVDRGARTVRFRAASATGALYHVDLYVVCTDLDGPRDDPDIPAGVYHFDPRTLSVDVLREGDYRGVLADAAGDEGVATAPVTVVATSTWWRNAWKYRERTFRHAFWDSGTILANLLAVAHALDCRAAVVTGFADRTVADLLGVDPRREAPLSLVAVGEGDPAPDPRPVESIDPATAPLSPTEREFPLIHRAWSAGTLESGDAADAWRSGRTSGPAVTGAAAPGDAGGETVALDPVDYETASARPLHATIARRGSCREYARAPISSRKLSTVLDRAVRGVPMDVRGEASPLAFVEPYLVVNGVEGLDPGAYRYRPASGDLEVLRRGEFRREAGHLALDQRLGADAAVCVYFLTDLDAVTDALGDRGYRVAQLEGALTAGRLYLATYAHRDLGGTGLTFYDDAVTEFFEPTATGLTPAFLYTMGVPA